MVKSIFTLNKRTLSAKTHQHLVPESFPSDDSGPKDDLVIDVEKVPNFLEGTSVEAIEIKMVVPMANDHPWRASHGGGHRRLANATPPMGCEDHCEA